MKIGIDFDNTIVCYDPLFHVAALKKRLIPDSLATEKLAVRNYLRSRDREDDWTELQGDVYGTWIDLAKPFPGVVEFIKSSLAQGKSVVIISHKTEYPFKGRPHNLHAAARRWMRNNKLERIPVFFEATKDAKLARIAEQACNCFIDDLPEFLCEKTFPKLTRPILFDPQQRNVTSPLCRLNSWRNAEATIRSTK